MIQFKRILPPPSYLPLRGLLLIGLVFWGSEVASAEGLLTAFVDSPVYSKRFSELSPAEQAKVKLHGIRNTMLHPRFWGTLLREKTYNVRITPMKRYFLRSSEDSSYRVKHLRCKFRFAGVDKAKILKSPHEFDPVLEIGFGSEVSQGRNNGYGLRISGYPLLPNALLRIEDSRSSVLALATTPSQGTYQTYELEVEFSDTALLARLNGQEFMKAELPAPPKGMVSLISSWHPVYISELEIDGTVVEDGKEVPRKDSGLLFQEQEAK